MHWKYLCITSLLGINISYTLDDISLDFPKHCYGISVVVKRSITLDKWPYNINKCGSIYKGSSISKSNILDYILKILRSKTDKDKFFSDIIQDINAYITILFTVGNRINNNTKEIRINVSDIMNKDFKKFWTDKFLSTFNVSKNIPHSNTNGLIRYSKDNSSNIYCVSVLSNYLDKKKLSKYIDHYIKEHEKYDCESIYYLLNCKFVDSIDKHHFRRRDHNNPFHIMRSRSISNKKLERLILDRQYLESNINLHELHSKMFKKVYDNNVNIDGIDRIINQSVNLFHYDSTLETKDMASLFSMYSNLYYIRNREDIFKRLFMLFVLIMRRMDNNYWLKEVDKVSYFSTSCKVLEALSIG